MSYHAERCKHKRRYRCHDDALAALAEVRDRRGDEGLAAYRCPFGPRRHWHLGHVPSLEALKSVAREIRGLDRAAVPQDGSTSAQERR